MALLPDGSAAYDRMDFSPQHKKMLMEDNRGRCSACLKV